MLVRSKRADKSSVHTVQHLLLVTESEDVLQSSYYLGPMFDIFLSLPAFRKCQNKQTLEGNYKEGKCSLTTSVNTTQKLCIARSQITVVDPLQNISGFIVAHATPWHQVSGKSGGLFLLCIVLHRDRQTDRQVGG